MKTFKEKLKFPNYIFEINDIDIADVYVEYTYFDYEVTRWKNGKKQPPEVTPEISIDVSGSYEDKNVSFGIELKKDLKYLNSLKENKMIEISDIIDRGETFINDLEGASRFLYINFPTNTEEDMYKEISHFYLLKKADNHFLFKIEIPTERLFAYFEIKFK